MPRRPPLALSLVLVVAGCSPALPSITVPLPPGAPSCAALVKVLPRSLAKGVVSRVVTPAGTTTAAWGNPAVVLRCGVPEGNPLDDPVELDGVRWLVHDDGAAHRWTTLDRAVPVEVVVPDSYDSQAELVIGLSAALTKT